MPTFLLSPTFWKFAGIAILMLGLSIAAGSFIHHYEYLKAQAALVEPLQRANKSLQDQAKRDDSRAAGATKDLTAALKARDDAVNNLKNWKDFAAKIGLTLEGLSRNANATKNPGCLPTDGERVLWNATVARFSNPDPGPGQPGTSGSMPAGAH